MMFDAVLKFLSSTEALQSKTYEILVSLENPRVFPMVSIESSFSIIIHVKQLNVSLHVHTSLIAVVDYYSLNSPVTKYISVVVLPPTSYNLSTSLKKTVRHVELRMGNDWNDHNAELQQSVEADGEFSYT